MRFDLRSITDLRFGEHLARRRAYKECLLALGGNEQQVLVDRLRAEILAIRAQGRSSPDDASWDLARRLLADHVCSGDPRCFLRWPEVRTTMFVLDSSYAATELEALMSDNAWSHRWRTVLTEDMCGCPAPSRLRRDTSDNLIHHVYHVLAAEKQLGDIQAFDQIIEFGGGYGSFARVVRRLGISCGYHMHDSPEFSALQGYYLASVARHRGEPRIQENVTHGSSLEELPAKRVGSRLFVALWSLSEVPLRDREPWFDVIAGCEGAIIAFQDRFEDVDNSSWFRDLQRRVPLAWSCWKIPHLRGSTYLVGRRE